MVNSIWHRLDLKVESLLVKRMPLIEQERQFGELLRAIAAATRTGATLPQALDHAARSRSGPVAQSMREAAAKIALGATVSDTVSELSGQLGTPAAELFAHIVTIQQQRGGDLAEPCHRLASLIHDRSRVDAENQTATAQARYSARAVIAIPFMLFAASLWKAPEAVQKMLTPSMVILALPGLVLITLGAALASKIARQTMYTAGGTQKGRRATKLSTVIDRMLAGVAGDGPKSLQAVRLALMMTSIFLVPYLIGARSLLTTLAFITILLLAISWPFTREKRENTRLKELATSGVEQLLEVSIALASAGATAYEVATIAPDNCPSPLRDELAPALHKVSLGVSIARAFRESPIVAATPMLDAWLHTISSNADLGARMVPTLDQLLRDARSVRREQIRSRAATAAPRMQLALVLLVVPGVMWLMLLATVGGLLEQLRAVGAA